MALSNLANGSIKTGNTTLYTAPLNSCATISSIQVVNPSGDNITLGLDMVASGGTSHITPTGFVLLAGHRLEFDAPLALPPGGRIKAYAGGSGLTFTITGEERFSTK